MRFIQFNRYSITITFGKSLYLMIWYPKEWNWEWGYTHGYIETPLVSIGWK